VEGDAWNIMFPPERKFSEQDLDFEQILFPYLANGITTVQVMSALPEHIALRDRINKGDILGPSLYLYRMIDGPGPTWPPPINTQVATPEEAHQIVMASKDAGYDGMKVYTFLNRECYDAILTTAKDIGMPVIGHVPNAISVEHTIASGQKLIAHTEEVMRQAHGDYSTERIEYFAEIITQNGIWITPTLTTSHKILGLFDNLERALSNPDMRYLHPMARGIWSFLIENIYLPIPAEHRQFIRRGFEEFQRPFTKALHEHGARLMTGTDVLMPTNIAGFSIHDELRELVDVGLTAYEALKTATTHPMEYLGASDDAGTINIGKRADLVLLNANPLEDISNTRKINGVLCQEEWLSQENIKRKLGESIL
jgi:hypothetical protein